MQLFASKHGKMIRAFLVNDT